jgi:hypothetical protein
MSASTALLMNGARDDFLARTALALDQNGHVSGGNLIDQAVDLLHRLTLAGEDVRVGSAPQSQLDLMVFGNQRLEIQGLAN